MGPNFSQHDEGILSIRDGRGAVIKDGRGGEWVDFSLNNGRLVLGHAHPNVVLGVKKCAERGIGFGTLSRDEKVLEAELLKKFSWLNAARFFASEEGALANAAVLACRTRARRNIVACCSQHTLMALNGLKSTDITHVDREDSAALNEACARYGEGLAGILVEPLIFGNGLRLVSKEFILEAAELAKRYGGLLIVDERRSGFHSAPGLCSLELGARPDIVCLGGVLGGGFELGAVLSGISEAAGSGEISPVIFRAALMTLRLLNEGFFKAVQERAQVLSGAVNAVGCELSGRMVIDCVHHLLGVRFSTTGGCGEDAKLYDSLRSFLLTQGIHISAQKDSPLCISSVHTKKQIERLKDALIGFWGTIT